MDERWAAVQKRIDTYAEEMVRFQAALVAKPALGPDVGGDGELEKAGLVEEWLRELGPIATFRVDAPDGRVSSGVRPNIVALFKGQGRGKVWVLSHLDVVPPGELGLWESDPFVLRRDGDRIYGRGVEDNHQGIVSSYFAMKAMRDEGIEPVFDVGLIFVADEETGSNYGLVHVLKERGDLFSPEDLIIVPDGGNKQGTMIEVAEKSMCWMKFTVTGRQCHASTPHRGINSLRAAARMITALDEALPAAFDAEDDLFTIPRSTFEPTKKEANVPNVNTIPGEDVFYFDARVLPQYPLEEVLAKAGATVEEIARATGVSVTVETAYTVQAPKPTPADAPVVQALDRAIREVLGVEPSPQGVGGGTVAAFFRDKGLPAAVWSTEEEMAHAPNEYASLKLQMADAKVMAHIFLGL
jgi:succinyl-diaminopimelate desuccinylase